jgi:hypothetical protein
MLALLALCLGAAGPRENIVLDGGRTGKVHFPHKRHHEALKEDCSACHALFPEEAGAIARFKAAGKFKKREVMNHCTACHKSMIRKKLKTGPVRCRGCHVKDTGKQ